MADIKYTIEFFSDWHCGSGLAAGADVDALVVKDKRQLPFVPGKTVKGLVREAVENIVALRGEDKEEIIKSAFGFFDDMDNSSKGEMFFTNAELEEEEAEAIVANKLQKYMCRSIASTAIKEDGIAKDLSLRKMEVVVPCVLHGMVKNVPSELVGDIMDGFKFVKRLGVNRNRGLGRCQIKGEEVKG